MDRKICVKGILWSTSTDSLGAYFSQFGEVLEADIVINERTGGSKGYGFVKFADPSIVSLVLGQHTIDGRRVEVMRKLPPRQLRDSGYGGPRGPRGNRRKHQQTASASHHAQLQSTTILDQDRVQMDGHGHGLIVPHQTNVGRNYPPPPGPPPPSSYYVTPPNYEYGAASNSGVLGGGYGEGYAGDAMINNPIFNGVAAYSWPNIVPAQLPTYYYEYATTHYLYHEQQQSMPMVMNRPIGQPMPVPVPVPVPVSASAVISTSNRNNLEEQGGGTGSSSSSSINLEERL